MRKRTMHGKLFLQGLTLLIACVCMVACSTVTPTTPTASETPSAEQTFPPKETALPSAEPSEIPPVATTQPIDVEKLDSQLAEKMNLLLGWGEGSAGSSLAVVVAAHDMVQWCDAVQVKIVSSEDVDYCIGKWFSALDAESYQDATANWAAVKETATAILQKDTTIADLLGDAGCDYIESESAAEHWEYFVGRVNACIQK